MTATPDIITAAALEAEKTLPPPVRSRSGPLEIHSVALLDRDGAIVATMPLISPVVPQGGDLVIQIPDLTFTALT